MLSANLFGWDAPFLLLKDRNNLRLAELGLFHQFKINRAAGR
jgi:hypothetical protein